MNTDDVENIKSIIFTLYIVKPQTNNVSSQCSIFNRNFKEHCKVLFNRNSTFYSQNVSVATFDDEINFNFSNIISRVLPASER